MISELLKTIRQSQKELIKLEILQYGLEIAIHGSPKSLWEEKKKMTSDEFCSQMLKAKVVFSGDYLRGYQYGLRRHYHGDNFGDVETISKIKDKGGDLMQGLLDGMAGKEAEIK